MPFLSRPNVHHSRVEELDTALPAELGDPYRVNVFAMRVLRLRSIMNSQIHGDNNKQKTLPKR